MASMIIIPQDVITTHILSRLPAKSVGRFRCVSEPGFVKTHHKTLGRNRFLFRSNDRSLCSVPFNDHEAVPTLTTLPLDIYSLEIHGSVNGLVLVYSYNLHDTLVVLNLTTKDYVEIPISDKIQSSGMNGFGYDSISNDYKVVIISFTPTNYWNVGVYNLRTNTWSWKNVSHSSYDDYCYKSWLSGVFVNGFIHWIFHSNSKPVKIIAFCLADEKVSELPPPNLSDQNTHLVALGEKLGIFDEVKGDVWLMNEYGVQKSWTKIVVYGFNEIRLAKSKVFYDNGKLLFLMISERLLIYDVEERTFCKSVDVSYIRDYIGAYAETLISPKFS